MTECPYLSSDALRVDAARFAYAYDAAGWFLIPGAVTQGGLDELNGELDRLGWRESDFAGTTRIDELVQRSAFFGGIAEEIAASEWLRAAMTYPHRLIESYALDRGPAGSLPLHGGSSERLTRAGLPLAEDISCAYFVRAGQMYSLRAKVLMYLDDVVRDEDGPLVYIEGSHKANYPFMQTFADGPRAVARYEHLLRRIRVRAGTILLVNEALVHGALEKRSDVRRRMAVLTFAPSFAADWSELARNDTSLRRHGYVVPDTADSH
jgi:hypothetical protein